MTVRRKNFYHTQELQKRLHDKYAKPRSYTPGKKVWFNNQYIKTKQNHKLEAKFFGLFQILYPVKNQVYKLEMPKNRKFIMFFTYFY